MYKTIILCLRYVEGFTDDQFNAKLPLRAIDTSNVNGVNLASDFDPFHWELLQPSSLWKVGDLLTCQHSDFAPSASAGWLSYALLLRVGALSYCTAPPARVTLPGMETRLQLWMQDGALAIAFEPKLTPDQYAELLEVSKESTTREELRASVMALAKTWGMEAQCDDA